MLCGCSQPASPTNSLTGHVYLNGYAISGAHVEAISVNGTDRIATITNDNGAYVLNIKPDIKYNVTATYQELRHTVWPVYLPGETDTYDINLTTTPKSTIEGSRYTKGGPNPEFFYHKRWSDVVINATSVKDNITLTALTDSNGSYSLEIEPNVLYNITGASSLQNKYPIPVFYYRNYGGISTGYCNQIMVGPNETALVDYIIYLP